MPSKPEQTLPLPITQWQMPAANEEARHLLAQDLKIHPLLSRILVNRSFFTPDEANRYLFPSLRDLHNPFLMKDMKNGVERVIQAIRSKEKIAIYGDYDVDGITSLVILYKFLKDLRVDVRYYIPHRTDEGYGLHRRAVEKIRHEGTTLLVTVDCGVSNHEEIAHARSLGMDTVVLDHHEVPDTLPAAHALISTNRSDCSFPFKHLAGVGIAFNFLIALRGKLREIGFWKERTYPNLKEYLDLVALGTIGDICPLLDENRIFVKFGLELIGKGKRIGLQALKDVSGVGDNPVDTATASFSLIPRINAAGRVASADDAVRLFLTEDRSEATAIARKLDDHNRTRQAMEKSILSEITTDIEKALDLKSAAAIVLASPRWHPGVIGIVASKLVDLYYRPSILISLKDGIGKGSGRSIPAFNLHRGLTLCQSRLIAFGGHRYAGGISIREEDIPSFRHLLESAVRDELKPLDFVPRTDIDACCSLDDITFELLHEIDLLAPFGNSNPEPLLHSRNVSVSGPSIVGNNHLRMRVHGTRLSCASIWFGKGQYLDILPRSGLDIVFTPTRNHWNGTSSIQLKLKDAAKSASNS